MIDSADFFDVLTEKSTKLKDLLARAHCFVWKTATVPPSSLIDELKLLSEEIDEFVELTKNVTAEQKIYNRYEGLDPDGESSDEEQQPTVDNSEQREIVRKFREEVLQTTSELTLLSDDCFDRKRSRSEKIADGVVVAYYKRMFLLNLCPNFIAEKLNVHVGEIYSTLYNIKDDLYTIAMMKWEIIDEMADRSTFKEFLTTVLSNKIEDRFLFHVFAKQQFGYDDGMYDKYTQEEMYKYILIASISERIMMNGLE